MLEPFNFSDEQKKAYRSAYAPTASDTEWSLFITECERRQLIPGTHVIFQLRPSQEYNKALNQRVTVNKVTFITTINALRLIAERSGKFEGYGRFRYYYRSEDGITETFIPEGRVPHAVSVELYRKGWREPVFSIARYDACVQTKTDGNRQVPNRIWTTRGEEQLAKCSEANGLRMIAPEECGGLYIVEESGDDSETPVNSQPAPAVIPEATVVPTVNQAPAEIPTALKTAIPAQEPAPKPSPAPTPKLPNRPPPPPKAAVPPAPAPKVAPPTAYHHTREAVAEITAQIPPDATGTDKEKFLAGVAVQVQKEADAPTPAERAEINDRIARDMDQPARHPGLNPPDPAGPTERKVFLERAAKIVRDKLKNAPGAGDLVKAYILRQTGTDMLRKLSAKSWEQILTQLEAMDVDQVVAEITTK